MDWSRLDRQIAAIGEAVGAGARQAEADARRAQRSLEHLDALERLLTATSAQRRPVPARARPTRASLHHSPVSDLFRDTDKPRR